MTGLTLNEARANRDRARASGEVRFIGRECKRRHSGERFTSTGNCVECLAMTSRARYEANIDLIAEQCRRYRVENASLVRARSSENYRKNKARISERKKAKYHTEESRLDRIQRSSCLNRKIRLKTYHREYSKQRRDTHPQTAIANRVRNRLRIALGRGGFSKPCGTLELLGCTWPEFVSHLESRFPDGMSWQNTQDWHLDHIKPLAAFDLGDEAQLRQACHYTNIQPLWAADNIRKGARIAA